MNEPKEGEKCSECGETFRRVEMQCRGKIARGEKLETFLACRCLHPGDYMCTCGNPCWSLF